MASVAKEVTDDDFNRAAGNDPISPASEAAQNAAQHVHATGRNEPHDENRESEQGVNVPVVATICERLQERQQQVPLGCGITRWRHQASKSIPKAFSGGSGYDGGSTGAPCDARQRTDALRSRRRAANPWTAGQTSARDV